MEASRSSSILVKKENKNSSLDYQIANLDKKVGLPPVFVINRKVYGSKPIQAKSDSLPIKIEALK
jgi:hypothetical protein